MPIKGEPYIKFFIIDFVCFPPRPTLVFLLLRKTHPRRRIAPQRGDVCEATTDAAFFFIYEQFILLYAYNDIKKYIFLFFFALRLLLSCIRKFFVSVSHLPDSPSCVCLNFFYEFVIKRAALKAKHKQWQINSTFRDVIMAVLPNSVECASFIFGLETASSILCNFR